MPHRNLALKAAALALAVFLWFWVLLNERNPIVERSVRSPVEVRGLKPDLALEKPLPDVDIFIRGLKRDIDRMSGRVQAYVSCVGLSAGRYVVPVEATLPEAIAVVRIEPDHLPIVLEPILRGRKPVSLSLVGEAPAGYEVQDVTVSPKTIAVRGPSSAVDRTTTAVVIVDLARSIPDVPFSLPVRAVDSSGREVPGVSLIPDHVNVRVIMKPMISSATVPVVLETRGSLPPGLRLVSVEIDPPMVTIVGPPANVQAVRAVATTDLPLSLVTESFTRKLPLVVPDGVNLLSTASVTVTLRVEHTPRPPESAPAGGD